MPASNDLEPNDRKSQWLWLLAGKGLDLALVLVLWWLFGFKP